MEMDCNLKILPNVFSTSLCVFFIEITKVSSSLVLKDQFHVSKLKTVVCQIFA